MQQLSLLGAEKRNLASGAAHVGVPAFMMLDFRRLDGQCQTKFVGECSAPRNSH